MIISVGYRVKSKRGIQFRQWATEILKQHLINGYSVNNARIKQIESSIEELVDADKIKTQEIAEIKELLKSLIARPIIINNHNKITLGSKDLEEKIIYLIDKITESFEGNKKVKTQLQKVKSDISEMSKNIKAKNRVIDFFVEIGDSKSDIYKTITGARIAKSIIYDLVKLGSKLRDLL